MNDKYIESLYSKIDLNLEKITSDKNFPQEDFSQPNTILGNNVFKSRALSFEYYINNKILIRKFKVKERPRVIYPFKPIEELENPLFETEENNLIEVDGVVFEEKEIKLIFEKNFFIVDKLYKMAQFENKNGKI